MKKAVFCVLLVAAVSCNRVGIMKDVPIRLCKPESVVSLNKDEFWETHFKEVLNCTDMQIVCDTLLVLQGQALKDESYFYVYSLRDFSLISAFGQKGRASGELLDPRMVSVQPDTKYLCFKDQKDVYKDDLGTMELKKDNAVKVAGMVDWLPLSDGCSFYYVFDTDSFLYRIYDVEGELLKSYDPHPDISQEYYVTFLSSCFTTDGDRHIAEAMLCLPQINFIDIETDEIKCCAVDKSYRNWRKMMNTPFNSSSMEYYNAVASSPDYVMAVYVGATVSDIYQGREYVNSIHIFNWDGEYEYEVKIDEHLAEIVFDNHNKYLYGLVKETGEIVRYEMSFL